MGFGSFTELVSHIGWDWTDRKVIPLRLLRSLQHHSPVHNVHFVKYDGPCGQKLKSKNTLSDGKKIFLRLFSYVVLGRKL